MIKDTYGSKEEHKLADQRKAALDNALRKIEKNFGKGSIMRMGDAADTKIATISSGSLAIDEALGVGDTHGAESLKCTVRKVPGRRPSLSTPSLKCNAVGDGRLHRRRKRPRSPVRYRPGGSN